MDKEANDGSIAITDKATISRYTSNPDFPYLVSFPRTGSHWLRMLMELYFEKPSLVRSFFLKEFNDFTCYHHHDVELGLERRNVIYLYREPVATIFSQMKYYNESFSDESRIAYWSVVYGKHLEKWLITEHFTTKKTILKYEKLKANLADEFSKICTHFGATFEQEKLKKVAEQVSKEKLKEKTRHDSKVVNLSPAYDSERSEFTTKYAEHVLKTVYGVNHNIQKFF
jgi:hypothetical protein